MFVKVITPDKEIFQGEVSQAKFPGASGSFEVLNNHAALISILSKGEMSLNTAEQGMKLFTIDGGVVEVLNNNVTVLIESIVE